MTLGLPVVILAGGLGTRLEKLGEATPKALVNVAGTTFLDRKIQQLVTQGVSIIYLLTGHRGDQIYDHVSQRDYGVPICLIPDGVSQLGTAGALIRALPAIPGDEFVLTYGDNLLDLPLANFCSMALEMDSSLMVVTSNIGAADLPNTRVAGEFVEQYTKSGGQGLDYVDYGYSFLRKEDLAHDSNPAAFDLVEIFSKLASARKLAAYVTDLSYFEIGTLESLRKVENLFKSNE